MSYADSLNESTKELHRLFTMIDFSKGYLFLTLSERIISVVREVVREQRLKVLYDANYLKYYLPKENALKFDIQ